MTNRKSKVAEILWEEIINIGSVDASHPHHNRGKAPIHHEGLAKKVEWSPDLEVRHLVVDHLHRKLLRKMKRICERFCQWELSPTEDQYIQVVQEVTRFTGALICHCDVENLLLLSQKNQPESQKRMHIVKHHEEIVFFRDLSGDLHAHKTVLTVNYLSLIVNRFRKHIIENDAPDFADTQFYQNVEWLNHRERK